MRVHDQNPEVLVVTNDILAMHIHLGLEACNDQNKVTQVTAFFDQLYKPHMPSMESEVELGTWDKFKLYIKKLIKAFINNLKTLAKKAKQWVKDSRKRSLHKGLDKIVSTYGKASLIDEELITNVDLARSLSGGTAPNALVTTSGSLLRLVTNHLDVTRATIEAAHGLRKEMERQASGLGVSNNPPDFGTYLSTLLPLYDTITSGGKVVNPSAAAGKTIGSYTTPPLVNGVSLSFAITIKAKGDGALIPQPEQAPKVSNSTALEVLNGADYEKLMVIMKELSAANKGLVNIYFHGLNNSSVIDGIKDELTVKLSKQQNEDTKRLMLNQMSALQGFTAFNSVFISNLLRYNNALLRPLALYIKEIVKEDK